MCTQHTRYKSRSSPILRWPEGEPLTTADVTTANVTTADSTANASTADVLGLGYGFRHGLGLRLGL